MRGCVTCWVALLVIIPVATGQDGKPLVSLKISAPEAAVVAGSTVRLTITITNQVKRVITVNRVLGGNGEFFHEFDVRRGRGEAVSETEYYRQFKGGKQDVVYEVIGHDLPPGESIEDEVTLSKLYDLTRPGQYTIQARRHDPGSKNYVRSNIITLTVR